MALTRFSLGLQHHVDKGKGETGRTEHGQLEAAAARASAPGRVGGGSADGHRMVAAHGPLFLQPAHGTLSFLPAFLGGLCQRYPNKGPGTHGIWRLLMPHSLA